MATVFAGFLGISNAGAQIDIQVGAITGPASNVFPRPYPENFDAARQQYLFLASELRTAGMLPGIIRGVSFYNPAGGGQQVQGYAIAMGATSAGTLSNTAWETTTPATNPATVTVLGLGWTVHNFNFPFTWDGTSNIVVEVCQQNTSTAGNPTTIIMSPGFNASHSSAQNIAGGGCGVTGLTTQGTQTNRPIIRFTYIPNCMPPSNIVVTDIKPYSATVNWTASPVQPTNAFANYNEWVDQSPTPPALAYNTTNNTFPQNQPGVLAPLIAETKYYVHVRTECDVFTPRAANRYSEWVTQEFTTIPDCLPPVPTIDQVSHKDAVASWPPVPTAYDYEYAVSADETMPPPSAGYRTQSTSAYLPGLISEKVYTFYVRAWCSPTPSSRWAKIPFTTARTTDIADADKSGFSLHSYPTPATDAITVEITKGGSNAVLQLADISGKTVRQATIDGEKTTIDINDLAPGVYLIKYTDDQRSKMMKIVKE